MKSANLAKLHFIAIFLLSGPILQAQVNPFALGGAAMNSIQTAVPFLSIAPDARAAGMGDAGVASGADVNSQHWNAAKYAFIDGKSGLSFTYTPWLSNLIPDIGLYYLSGYYRINPKNTVSASFRYFSLGSLSFGFGVPSNYQPREFAIDAGYSRLLTDHFSGGIVFRYIQSDLLDGSSTPNGQAPKPGTSVAADLGLYYQKEIDVGEKNATWALGMNISNIGTRVSYSEDAEGTPIPTNLRLGAGFKYEINSDHAISMNGDLNKLLVPTSAVYDVDTATGDLRVVRGKAPPRSVVAGMFQSFSDAPGVQKSYGEYSVFQEEMHEISYSLGLEYNFRDFIGLRSGYFHEHSTKGNRKYFTFGLGVMIPHFFLELSYLSPANGQNSPLANTFRLTISAVFGSTTPINPE